MKTRKHTPEQIIAKLRQAEVELSKGLTVPQVAQAEYYRADLLSLA